METIACPFSIYGCAVSKMPVDDLETHLTAEASDHLNLLCIELVNQKNAASVIRQKQEQEWRKDLEKYKSTSMAREAAMEKEIQSLKEMVETQAALLGRLTRGSIIVVDHLGCGLFRTIGEALGKCQPGDTITIRPGTYKESLTINKPGIIINGSGLDTEIEGLSGSPVLTVGTALTISGLKLVQSDPAQPCVLMNADTILDGCELTSQAKPCVMSKPSVKVTLKNTFLSGGKEAIVEVASECTAILEKCKIFESSGPCVSVNSKAHITIQESKLHDSGDTCLILRSAKCIISKSEIYNALHYNVLLEGSSEANITNSKVHAAQKVGVLVQKDATATLTDNEIYACHVTNVEIQAGGNADLGGNSIHHSRHVGVLIRDKATANLDANHIHSNIANPVEAENGASVQSTNNRFKA